MYNINELEERLNTQQDFKSVAVSYHGNTLVVSIIANNIYANLGFNEKETENLTTQQLVKKVMRKWRKGVQL